MPGLRFKIDFCLRRFAGFSSRLDVREGYSGISGSATLPRTALWPRATICADAELIDAKMMLAKAKAKTRAFRQFILAPSIFDSVQSRLNGYPAPDIGNMD